MNSFLYYWTVDLHFYFTAFSLYNLKDAEAQRFCDEFNDRNVNGDLANYQQEIYVDLKEVAIDCPEDRLVAGFCIY